MTHLIDARKALNAELDSLRTRAEQIITLLDGLNALDAAEIQEITTPAKVKKDKPAAKKAAPAKKAAAPKKAAPAKNGALPKTKAQWFVELIDRPMVRREVLDAAANKIGGSLSKETIDKLGTRMDVALSRAVILGRLKKAKTEAGFVYSKA